MTPDLGKKSGSGIENICGRRRGGGAPRTAAIRSRAAFDAAGRGRRKALPHNGLRFGGVHCIGAPPGRWAGATAVGRPRLFRVHQS